jgi:pimeloyl-ACP methyl ester carboxylesterase
MVSEVPRTRYAKSGDVNIAYQVVGEGPIDLVFIPGWVSHVECQWEDPQMARFFTRLTSFARLIVLDKRGTGMSDRVSADKMPTLEERMDDVRAVMDAAGVRRAALLGVSEGGPMSVLFAATYPERTSALIVYGSFARWIRTDDYPWAPTREQHEGFFPFVEALWGQVDEDPGQFAPSMRGDRAYAERSARFQRMASSPGAAVALYRMNIEVDVRAALPAISVPTLVLHRVDDQLIRVGAGRHLAEHIPDAKLVELAGQDHLFYVGDSDAIVDEVEEFLTGVRGDAGSDRVLATVLFTDIVSSTEQLVAAGDRDWRVLLDRHDAMVRAQLTRFRGREVSTAGDSFFAVFDGPARAIRCARAIVEGASALGIEVRAGVHTGECEVRGDDYGGIAVHIGARIAALANAGEVLTTSTVKDLVAGSGIAFADYGVHPLKGVPEPWQVFRAS